MNTVCLTPEPQWRRSNNPEAFRLRTRYYGGPEVDSCNCAQPLSPLCRWKCILWLQAPVICVPSWGPRHLGAEASLPPCALSKFRLAKWVSIRTKKVLWLLHWILGDLLSINWKYNKDIVFVNYLENFLVQVNDISAQWVIFLIEIIIYLLPPSSHFNFTYISSFIFNLRKSIRLFLPDLYDSWLPILIGLGS